MGLTLAQVRKTVRVNTRATTEELGDEEIDNIVNQALNFANAEGLYVPIGDETLVQANDTWEYPLTGGGDLDSLLYISNIFSESADVAGLFEDTPINRKLWKIEEALTPVLVFHRDYFSIADGKKLRILGLKSQVVLNSDNEDIKLPSAYITWKATEFAHSLLSGVGAASRAIWHERQVGIAALRAETARYGANEYKVPPGSKLVRGRV